MQPSPCSPLRSTAARNDARDRTLALTLALAAGAAAALPGSTACSRCDLYYYPLELSLEESPVDADLFAVAAAQEVALAVGDGGTILRRIDGVWTAQASGTEAALRGVEVTGAGVALAVGDGGTILRSADAGVTWSAVDAGVTAGLAAVRCRKDGTCVAVGDDTLLVSLDAGATWATPGDAPPEPGALRAVGIDRWTFHSFIAVGLAGAIVVSDDGRTWTSVPGSTTDYAAVASDSNDWVLAGADGALFVLLINDELFDNSLFEPAAVTGMSRDGRWMVRDDGSLRHGEPLWQEEANVVDDAAGRPMFAVASIGDEALVVGAEGLVGRGRVADEMECVPH
ncbi:WD40/YVTN/BNR-like repeat-containing protein [Nannocystis radixulma]|uniref:Photosynthesis system II assembly factor Ycf48/Hcf136-like domain-containing protein n=1 Tax=Nannocystis radixulma TaxID=2995305 RepID=A0ABT5BEK0_9BACT|nr:hypothetical protein [Nannocystis radixulma]MDC0672568.1 hypothetical protein [Nannocystis radixulma]